MPDDTPIPTPDGRVRRPYQGASQPAPTPDPDQPLPAVPDDGIREE